MIYSANTCPLKLFAVAVMTLLAREFQALIMWFIIYYYYLLGHAQIND